VNQETMSNEPDKANVEAFRQWANLTERYPDLNRALSTGDFVQANERLFQLSGGKTTRQVAEEWARLLQEPESEDPR
jgi:hypothetical protein